MKKRWLFLLCSASKPPASYGLGKYFKPTVPIRIATTSGSYNIQTTDELDLLDSDAMWIMRKGIAIRIAWDVIIDVVLDGSPWRSKVHQ